MPPDLAIVQKVGYALWGAVLALGLVVGLTLVGGSAPSDGGEHDAVEAAADASTDAATAYAEDRWDVPVSLDFDGDGPAFDVGLDLPGVGVDVENAGHPSETQSVELQSGAIDGETAKSASTGLCVVGLGAQNPSGVQVAVDGESGSVDASIDPSPDTERDRPRESTTDIVERCSGETER